MKQLTQNTHRIVTLSPQLAGALDAVSEMIGDDKLAIDNLRACEFHRLIIDISTNEMATGILSAKLEVDEAHESRRTAYRDSIRKSQRQLMESAFRFLTSYVRGSPLNQLAVEPCLSFLLNHYLGAELAGSGSELLFFHEVVKGCYHCGQTVSGKHLAAICRHCRWSPTNNSAHLYVELLAILAHTSGHSILENQNAIFDQLKDFGMAAIDIDMWLVKHPKDERLNSINIKRLLKLTTSEKGTSRVLYHVSVMHLLANCAAANSNVASQLRNFLPLAMFFGQHEGIFEPGVLCALDGLDDELVNAYVREPQTLPCAPCVLGS